MPFVWLGLLILGVMFVGAAVLSPRGHQVAQVQTTSTQKTRQLNWENQKGEEWDLFSASYLAAFRAGCEALFDQSPDGYLYARDSQHRVRAYYSVENCTSLAPMDAAAASAVPVDLPDDPASAGGELGERAGCRAMFDEWGIGTLNHARAAYTADDCPLAVPRPTSSRVKPDPVPAPVRLPPDPIAAPVRLPPPPKPLTTIETSAALAAKVVASAYTRREFGISSKIDRWDASCMAGLEDWSCIITFYSRCRGTVMLGGQTLRAVDTRISCVE